MSDPSWGSSGPSVPTRSKPEWLGVIAAAVGGFVLLATFFFLWQGAEQAATTAKGEAERLKVVAHNAEYDTKVAIAHLTEFRRKAALAQKRVKDTRVQLGQAEGALALKKEQLGYFTACFSGIDAAYAAAESGNTGEATQLIANANSSCEKAQALI